MRKFLSNKAGATFMYGSNLTFNFRSDCMEMIFKLNKGTYGIVNVMIGTDPREILLFVNCGEYFKAMDRMTNVELFLSKMESPCPKLYKLATGDLPFEIMELPNAGCGGIGRVINYDKPVSEHVFLSFISEKTIDAAKELAVETYNMVVEIYHQSPLQDWKNRLDDIWD